ncbi:isochorismatase family protein [Pseudogulbenkiania ferrooxidans]|uniref:nicotinamidase n=1 Tax=Pseudogulbenkiania ferrooxidans 2002 TaxID=279714 RepID=B9Z820_9NEIS|nr:isochorismatase family protein [Pseudogulbenkiania ferrooxidans]EEG07075.1 isochorismatase hydrolase [Pseudogulbenkiania ferrooxidans 2002]
MSPASVIALSSRDALIVVDVQNDFLPGGHLPVGDGDEVVPVLNRYIDIFVAQGLAVYATRDWHPAGHCSFTLQGGPWPVHCVAGSDGALFPPTLHLPRSAVIVSKATQAEHDAYSGFDGTELAAQLRRSGVERVFVGGLATDYCVLNTVRDALKQGFTVCLLVDAIRAVNVDPDDGMRAEGEMCRLGAHPVVFQDLAA